MTDLTTPEPLDDSAVDDDASQDGPSANEDLDLEAPELDAAEQHRVVTLDEDDYR